MNHLVMKLSPHAVRGLSIRIAKLSAALAMAITAAIHSMATTAAETPSVDDQADPVPWGLELEDYGEFLANPEELAAIPVNNIVDSMRLNSQAMTLGETVYTKNCAECHGVDLKGLASKHTPDLTDSVWRFSGDDLQSGGGKKFPSDVEWTVRYGIRSGNPNARGIEGSMLAFEPRFRNQQDTEDYGTTAFLSKQEIAEMTEYVLQLSGQPHDSSKARSAAYLFQDSAKGNCYDCHGRDGRGRATLGSTDLTNKDMYLYGSDRAAILESIAKGRRSEMPAFDVILKPEEIKAVSVFVFSHASN